jgi:hypothetical protein
MPMNAPAAAGLASISLKDPKLFREQCYIDGEWVSPVADIHRYIELGWRYLKTSPRVYTYVCGGLVFETVFTVCVSMVLIASDRPRMALAVAGLSLVMILPWLAIDGISVCRGRISGDLSGLWLLARMPTLVLLIVFVAARGAIIWYTLH